jgi:hypothetical protein
MCSTSVTEPILNSKGDARFQRILFAGPRAWVVSDASDKGQGGGGVPVK